MMPSIAPNQTQCNKSSLSVIENFKMMLRELEYDEDKESLAANPLLGLFFFILAPIFLSGSRLLFLILSIFSSGYFAKCWQLQTTSAFINSPDYSLNQKRQSLRMRKQSWIYWYRTSSTTPRMMTLRSPKVCEIPGGKWNNSNKSISAELHQ